MFHIEIYFTQCTSNRLVSLTRVSRRWILDWFVWKHIWIFLIFFLMKQMNNCNPKLQINWSTSTGFTCGWCFRMCARGSSSNMKTSFLFSFLFFSLWLVAGYAIFFVICAINFVHFLHKRILRTVEWVRWYSINLSADLLDFSFFDILI